jgi:amino acid adenylation domain-containing protein
LTNLVAIRTDFSGDPTFRELLARIRHDVLDAQAHKDLPFDKLVQALDLKGGPSYHPVFQILFQFHDLRDKTAISSALTIETLDLNPGNTELDFSLEVTVNSEGSRCTISYDKDLFEVGTVQRMLGHYQTILEAIAGNPDCRVSQSPILTEAERRRMLVEWNDTRAEFPQTCFQQMFEEQVLRSPDRVAVIYQERSLTYSQLNQSANRLAHCLRSLGVGPDVIVGICIERSIEMVVGLLAILKAGGAYVPLDPSYPKQRLAFMLADLEPRVLLCQKQFVDMLGPQATGTLLVEEWPQITAGQSEENPGPSAKPKNLAYVLYTSGSTGQPKGVLIPHRALTNYLAWCNRAYPMDHGEGSPVHTPIGFDLTITSLLLPLVVGQKAILVREDPSLKTLVDAVRAGSFGLVKVTPSHLEALSHRLSPQEAASVTQTFVIGGEALKGETLSYWRRHAPATRLINEYGPTEATVGCSIYELPAGAVPASAIPIGRPISNVQLYVLDRNLQPVPIGVPGELYIAGEGLALGYHRRPELTAQRLIPNPFSSDPGARMYKTGDLVRYRADGNLEFLGRLDYQVKIRGFRIELSEIEATLAEYPGVSEAVATAWEAAPGARRLVAYVVCEQTRPSEDELRDFLKQRLPDYMLPAAYIFLPAFPLTSNGKVDRRALPLPGEARENRVNTLDAVTDPLEFRLLQIWKEVLQARSISVKDDFFQVGGDSLLAMVLLTRMEEVFNIEVPIDALLQAPTIEGLACMLRDPDSLKQPRLLGLQTNGSRPAFLCVGAYPLFRTLAHRLGFDQPFLGVPLPGLNDLPSAPDLGCFARYCITVLRTAQPEGPYFLGGWSDCGVLAYEIAQQLQQQGQHVALLVIFDAHNPAYVRSFAGLDRSRTRVFFLGQWLKFHWEALRRKEGRGVLKYLTLGLSGRLKSLRAGLWRILYRFRRRVGQTIESGQKNVPRILSFVVSNYQPAPYSGPVLLFRRGDRPTGRFRDAQYGWGKLISRLVIREVPGQHVDMFLEPAVEIVAQELSARLVEEQEAGAPGVREPG